MQRLGRIAFRIYDLSHIYFKDCQVSSRRFGKREQSTVPSHANGQLREKPRELLYYMANLLESFDFGLSERIRLSGNTRSYGPNQPIFFEGDKATFLPIVLSGTVKMVKYPEVGKEVILGLFHSGEAFAIPPAMDGKRFPATAIATDKSEVLLIPRDRFLELMQSSYEFSAAITSRMCGILRHQVETIQILATPSAEQRIAAALLRLAGEDGGDRVIEIAYRRKDIAEMTGLSLETTIRGVRRLAKKNCLKIVGGRIVLETRVPLRKLIGNT